MVIPLAVLEKNLRPHYFINKMHSVKWRFHTQWNEHFFIFYTIYFTCQILQRPVYPYFRFFIQKIGIGITNNSVQSQEMGVQKGISLSVKQVPHPCEPFIPDRNASFVIQNFPGVFT